MNFLREELLEPTFLEEGLKFSPGNESNVSQFARAKRAILKPSQRNDVADVCADLANNCAESMNDRLRYRTTPVLALARNRIPAATHIFLRKNINLDVTTRRPNHPFDVNGETALRQDASYLGLQLLPSVRRYPSDHAA